jgi:hypothetical protein
MATLSVSKPAAASWPKELQQLEPRLQVVVQTLFEAVVEISVGEWRCSVATGIALQPSCCRRKHCFKRSPKFRT